MLLYGKSDLRTWIIIVLFSVFLWAAIVVPYKIKPIQQEPKYRITYNEVTQKYRAEEWRKSGSGSYFWANVFIDINTPLDYVILAEAEKIIVKHRQKIENERNIDDGWKTVKEIF